MRLIWREGNGGDAAVWAPQCFGRGVRFQVPEFDRFIATAGCQQLSIWGKGNGIDNAPKAAEHL